MSSNNPFGLEYNSVYIETKYCYVRSLQLKDCAGYIAMRANNYDILQSREPIWDMDALNYQGYRRLMNDLITSFQIGNYYSMGIFHKENHEYIGNFEISNILYWPKQSASIGYSIDQKHTGKGYATDVLANMAQWSFKTFNLVKLEAGTMISNEASQRVLTKAGFFKEGLSHCYGEINGTFEDHLLWGLTQSELNKQYLVH